MPGRFIGTFHITTLGWIVLLLFPVAVAVFLIGPSSAQAPALVVAVLVLLLVVGGSFSGGRRGGGIGAVRNAAAEIDSRERSEPIEQEVDDPEAWRKERERRERAEQEQASVKPDQASWPQ
jgi:hypothetical protein